MTEQQNEFLHLCVLEGINYTTISEKLQLPKKTLTKWYDDLKVERKKMEGVRKLWKRKKIDSTCSEFYTWFTSPERKCHYCGISEKEIHSMLETFPRNRKRIAKRGKTIELDRKDSTDEKYTLKNLTFSCYWCNNAKTDEFTEEEFLEIGKTFASVWKKRLSK